VASCISSSEVIFWSQRWNAEAGISAHSAAFSKVSDSGNWTAGTPLATGAPLATGGDGQMMEDCIAAR
jgi:hypothetical protein